MAHTPGPWKVSINSVGQRWVETDDKNVALCPGEDDIASANAHLIAAAPRMYEYIETRAKLGSITARKLLKDISGVGVKTLDIPNSVAQAKQAIAKAEGNQ